MKKQGICLAVAIFSLFLFLPKASAFDITLNGTGVHGLIADSTTSSRYSNTNYGTDTIITVNGNLTDVRRIFTLWNMSVIPAGQTIISAKLKLYAVVLPYSIGPNATEYTLLRAYRVYNTTYIGWSETNITHNTQPSQGTLQQNQTGLTQVNNWIEWDVINAVTQAYNDTSKRLGLMIREDTQADESNKTLIINFTSREGAVGYRPVLEIMYTSVEGITQDFLLRLVTLFGDMRGMITLSLTSLSYGITFFTRHEEMVMYMFTIIVFMVSFLGMIPQGIGFAIAINALCMSIMLSKSRKVQQ